MLLLYFGDLFIRISDLLFLNSNSIRWRAYLQRVKVHGEKINIRFNLSEIDLCKHRILFALKNGVRYFERAQSR